MKTEKKNAIFPYELATFSERDCPDEVFLLWFQILFTFVRTSSYTHHYSKSASADFMVTMATVIIGVFSWAYFAFLFTKISSKKKKKKKALPFMYWSRCDCYLYKTCCKYKINFKKKKRKPNMNILTRFLSKTWVKRNSNYLPKWPQLHTYKWRNHLP